jgi:hypothetical protein
VGVVIAMVVGMGTKVYDQINILNIQRKLLATSPAGPVDSWSVSGVNTSETQFGTARTAKLFRDYLTIVGLQSASPGFLYCQKRQAAGGSDRIVVITNAGLQVVPGTKPSTIRCTAVGAVFVIAPGGIWSKPHDVLSTNSGIRPLVSFDKSVVLMAGVSDATDRSHFTLDIQADGQLITVDGWLAIDDSVLLQPRPAVPIPPPTSLPVMSP